MSVIKYDLSGVDPEKSRAGGGEQAPPNVYPAKIVTCDVAEPEGKDRRIEVVIEITKPKGKYAFLYDYINLVSEASQWKLDQFLQALVPGVEKKRTGTLDTKRMVNKPCQIRVKGETWNNEYRAKVGAWLPKDGAAPAEAESADANDEISLEMHGAAADSGDAESVEYLSARADEAGLDADSYETWEDLATALGELEAEPDEDEDEEEVETSLTDVTLAEMVEDADNDGDDYLEALYELGAEREVDPDEFDTWGEWMLAYEEAGEGDGEGGDAEAEDYTTWTLKDLKDLCKEREISSAGGKDTLVQRLEEYDASDPFAA